MGLPLADPQFWFVTALVALVAFASARRVKRSLGSDAASPCANCPKVAPGAPHPTGTSGASVADDKKSRLRVVSLLALALLPAAVRAASVERTVAAMGTTLTVEVEIATHRAAALAVAEAMIREVEATEAKLSTWRDDSELARINRAPVGRWVDWPSPELAHAVGAALQCADETNGAFDPTVGALVEIWGLRRGGRVASNDEIERALMRVGWRAIGRDTDHVGFLRDRDVILEEGGFGKGAALDRALDLAERAGERGEVGFVRLDLGGQIAWANVVRPTVVDLADPRDRDRPVLELALFGKRGSIATSGNSERGHGIGHLLDPRTGRPAADFGSSSSIDRSALRADCLSTALFVLGPGPTRKLMTDGNRWLEGVLLVEEGERLRALISPHLETRVRALDRRVVIDVARRP